MPLIQSLIEEQRDYLALVFLTILIFGILHRYLWQRRCSKIMAMMIWWLVLVILVCGWLFLGFSVKRERLRMQEMVEGYAPTYAKEMELLEHEKMSLDTPPDDPGYLKMIAALKRWLGSNLSLCDIYTVRKLPDGSFALIVDSETDYNRNGKYDEDREQRTKIGEPYEADLLPSLEIALTGKPAFMDKPYTDDWGTWVSAAVPIYNSQGVVEAALGVDYDASAWLAALDRTKWTAIAATGIFLAILGTVSVLLVSQNEKRVLQLQVLAQKKQQLEKKKLETLVNSIDGIVWETDAQTFRFHYVSRQCQQILGYSPEEWLSDERFWDKKLHPDDQWAHAECERLVTLGAPYRFEYRMITADNRIVWIQENAAVLLDEQGIPLVVRGVYHDITHQKAAAEELEKTHLELLKSSRLAGMAEVATGVLHNVGNVLNSVNVSASLVYEKVQRSQAFQLGKLAALLNSRQDDIPEYFTRDPQGRKLPEYLDKLGQYLVEQNQEILSEISQLTHNIEHINKIVAMQQSYAKMSGVYETLPLDQLINDAISMNHAGLARHQILVTTQYESLPNVPVDRHKLLQILVNLIRNAKHAHDESAAVEKRIRITLTREGDFAAITVVDNGIGIPGENLDSIFRHGFTTRVEGHGFGLHSSANAAAEMNGSLNVSSPGLNQGAAFQLKIPMVIPTS